MQYLPRQLVFSRKERQKRGREYSELVDIMARFTIAIAGGASLIVPMVIMALSPSQMKSLVTVPVAVVVFSLMLAFSIRAANIETLVSTARYAAVLVVFVGTNSANN